MSEDYKYYKEMLESDYIKNYKKKLDEQTLFEITKYPYREIVASNILRFYFDVNEEHKLDDLFLNALINVINRKYKQNKSYIFNEATAHRERCTEKGKKIDIVILCKDVVIGIENKIRAALYNDLGDYYKKMEKYNKEIIAIVLSAYELSSKDKEYLNEYNSKEKGEFKHILYLELFDEVDRLLKEHEYEDNKWIIFYKEFAKTMRKKERNVMLEQEFIEFYAGNKEEIRKLIDCMYESKLILINKCDLFKEILEKRIDKKYRDKLVIGHWNYNNYNIKMSDDGLYTICNIKLIELGITIDNVITPEYIVIQIFTGKKKREKILEVLKKCKFLEEKGIECKPKKDSKTHEDSETHIVLSKYYCDKDEELIEANIELIKYFIDECKNIE